MLCSGLIVNVIFEGMFIVVRLQCIGLGCSRSVLKFLNACSGQAEVTSKAPQDRLRLYGLGLLPLWFFGLCQLGFMTRLCASDSGSTASLFLVFVSMMFTT